MVTIIEAPDDETMAKLALAIGSQGASARRPYEPLPKMNIGRSLGRCPEPLLGTV